jgi:aminoglycoside phosphotransferase (APT) family kinase protein
MTDATAQPEESDHKLMGVVRRDVEQLRSHLLPWLRKTLTDADDVVLHLPTTPKSGGSSETFLIDLDIHEGRAKRRERMVVRVEPTVHLIYQRPAIEPQFRTLQVLSEQGRGPVPKMYWYEPDPTILGAPFFVMSRVEGKVADDRYYTGGLFVDSSPSEREAMWNSAIEALASIHLADPARFGFLDRPELGTTPLEQEVALWDSYVHWMGVPVTPIHERAQRWLHDHQPRDMPPGLTWGDARIPNLIFQDGVCRAVLDWETVSLCGPECDLGWLLFFDWLVSEGHDTARLAGVPDRDSTVKMWSQLVGRTPDRLEWAEVFATWRFCMIRDRALHLANVKQQEPDTLLERLHYLVGG